MAAPAIGYALILRLELPSTAGAFGAVASAIGDAGGIIGAVDMRSVGKTHVTRDFTVTVASDSVANAPLPRPQPKAASRAARPPLRKERV